MASSRIRTHQGKSFNNDGSRSTIMDLLQRDPIADQLSRSSRSHQSVQLDGGVLTLATNKASCNSTESHVQTTLLARADEIVSEIREARLVVDDQTEARGRPAKDQGEEKSATEIHNSDLQAEISKNLSARGLTHGVNLDRARHNNRGFRER